MQDEGLYRWPRDRIARFAHDVTSLKGTRLARESLVRDAVHLYTERGVDFSDALIAAEVLNGGYEGVYTYDRDFDLIVGVERVEP